MTQFPQKIHLPSFFQHKSRRPSYFLLLTSYFALATAALAATPLALNPYTFAGRITDSRGVAFDATRTATLRAYDAASNLLERTTTFFRDDTRNNYYLAIPMASSAATGAALQGDTLLITATDDTGRLWSGVIDPAVVGAPSAICFVDIVLAEDADGDGIDDNLLEELRNEWAAAGFAAGGAEFDPNADYDHDGLSTLDEARLGTDPFNGEDTLQIESLDLSSGAPVLTATLPAGHVYTLETTRDLGTSWTPADFATADAPSTPRARLATPSSPDRLPVTLYLLPTNTPTPVFIRLNAH